MFLAGPVPDRVPREVNLLMLAADSPIVETPGFEVRGRSPGSLTAESYSNYNSSSKL